MHPPASRPWHKGNNYLVSPSYYTWGCTWNSSGIPLTPLPITSRSKILQQHAQLTATGIWFHKNQRGLKGIPVAFIEHNTIWVFNSLRIHPLLHHIIYWIIVIYIYLTPIIDQTNTISHLVLTTLIQ